MTMRQPLAFLLDENIPKKVLLAMRGAGYTVTRVYDEKLGFNLILQFLPTLVRVTRLL